MNQTARYLSAALLAATMGLEADGHDLVIHADRPGADISPTMYGLFFEDINYAADGGLYAEKIKNRSFEFPQNFMGWQTFGGIELRDDGPFERNPHYVRLSAAGHPEKHSGLINEGFFGIGIGRGEEYRFSVWARVPEGGSSKLVVQIASQSSRQESQEIASATITIDSKEWKKYTAVLKSDVTDTHACLRIFLAKPDNGDDDTHDGLDEVTVDVEHVSLFPVNTWKGQENGLRADLAQALYDIRPGVLRFPGGCVVEGTDLGTRYQWKNTVGPVENRPLNENRWHYTFTYRFFPDYYQSGGLGFFEYFRLAEDLGAEPLPIVNVGLACQYQNSDDSGRVPLDSLQPYIQDALDLIEFANGDVESRWGSLRAEMGHPEPFGMKYIGIGNEQWGPEYIERLEPFVAAVRKAHPEIQIVGSSGPNSEGEQFDYLWPQMKRLKADMVDEHFYRPEDWFLSQGKRYDNYDRKGPKVFAGEYACHGKDKQWNHFNASLLEAAFMTGLERNADVVRMATYAPLFAHTDGWQWRPDMIWFDNNRSVKTASYYVQQLFSKNKGSYVLPLTMDKKPVAGGEGQHGLFASAVYDKDTDEIVVKTVNTSDSVQSLDFSFKGIGRKHKVISVAITTFTADDPNADNTLDKPDTIVPTEQASQEAGPDKWSTEIGPKTFCIYRFALK